MKFREHSVKDGWSDWQLARLAVDIRRMARYGGTLKAEVEPRMTQEFTADEVRRVDAYLAASVPDTNRLTAIDNRLEPATIAQTRVEEILAERAMELGVRILRGHRLTGLHQDDSGVRAEVDSPAGRILLRSSWLVGCDGGRSTVRKLAGIGFPGTPARRFTLLGDVVLADPQAIPFGVTAGANGTVFAIPRPGYVRLITNDPQPPDNRNEPVTLSGFQDVLDRALGRHVEIAEAHWLTRFGDTARLAEQLRHGRVLLAGDAAHIHPPAGAIGVNAGIDDAMNLGWKLGLVARGQAPESLLDTYHTERHAAGARLLRNTAGRPAGTRQPAAAAGPHGWRSAAGGREHRNGLAARGGKAVGGH
ncbi:FAD-dependent monooxygenase [Streptomyces sp. BE133]|uniref:FAD-dependent monooxygenase n=1 Tax=Streptomyces sp. BE133 TaxID=3002523 RepID=UPI002E78C070|nr:FAD-dependent monooxygenase [Streptomyces sp. BE133]MEE1806912.1 FAD-dependent monooxygenase [Streptomyces sp. BE133]